MTGSSTGTSTRESTDAVAEAAAVFFVRVSAVVPLPQNGQYFTSL
jgi:hypothetical protein